MSYTGLDRHVGAVEVLELSGEANGDRTYFGADRMRRVTFEGSGDNRTLTFHTIVGNDLVVSGVSAANAAAVQAMYPPDSIKAVQSAGWPKAVELVAAPRGVIKSLGVATPGTLELWSTDQVLMEVAPLRAVSHVRSRPNGSNIDMTVLLTNGMQFVAVDVAPARMSEWVDAMITGVWGGGGVVVA